MGLHTSVVGLGRCGGGVCLLRDGGHRSKYNCLDNRRRVVVARTEVRRNRSASTVGTKRYCVLQSLKTNH